MVGKRKRSELSISLEGEKLVSSRLDRKEIDPPREEIYPLCSETRQTNIHSILFSNRNHKRVIFLFSPEIIEDNDLVVIEQEDNNKQSQFVHVYLFLSRQ